MYCMCWRFCSMPSACWCVFVMLAAQFQCAEYGPYCFLFYVRWIKAWPQIRGFSPHNTLGGLKLDDHPRYCTALAGWEREETKNKQQDILEVPTARKEKDKGFSQIAEEAPSTPPILASRQCHGVPHSALVVSMASCGLFEPDIISSLIRDRPARQHPFEAEI
ncbi:hypothetical protein B0T16DRAFT_176520 [Cercophora newfieldiana]|uniref:Secreted protein n=1 Tax=Cercophora newfieldiana TaxID=92897 RepID=A0AA39XZP4_9PEZI|nr:hypothetical protein B0T16DRAFT_176520 [Cercophora newfieldiana]